jgi:hypothetical protein
MDDTLMSFSPLSGKFLPGVAFPAWRKANGVPE